MSDEKTAREIEEAMKPWWDAEPVNYGDLDADLAMSGLMSKAIKSRTTVLAGGWVGLLPEGLTYDEITKTVEEHGFYIVWERPESRQKGWIPIYCHPHGSMMLKFDRANNKLHIQLNTIDPDLYEVIASIGQKLFTPAAPPQGAVHAMLATSAGVQIQRIGTVKVDLIRDNYSPTALASYDQVIKDLNSETPRGRVSIFDGPPGTGKTYLLRSLFSAAPKCHYVMVPPKLVNNLNDPGMLLTLIQSKHQHVPLVLVLEDADEVISPRNAKTMSGLQVALNLGDGVMGDLINVRIVATTNSPVGELDEAIRRPGRLSARVEVGRMEHEHARHVFTRLKLEIPREKLLRENLPGMDWPREPLTLAEVYGKALDCGWQPGVNARGVVNTEDEKDVDD